MAEELFEPGFVRELEALRRRLEIRSRSGGAGEHTSKKRGGAAEFLEHRSYVPGDDPRRIDWLAFARSGEPVLKLFRAEEDVVLRLVLDTSRSLEVGTPHSKLHHAKRLAACLGYMALASSERAQVISVDETLGKAESPVRGRNSLPKLLRSLSDFRPDRATNLGASLDALLKRCSRPGMLVLFSDFFDASAYEQPLKRAKLQGHDVVLVQVLAPEEVEPGFEGDLALEDSETGDIVEMTIDDASLRAYQGRLRSMFDALRALSKTYRFSYVRTTTDDQPLPVVRRILSRSIDP